MLFELTQETLLQYINCIEAIESEPVIALTPTGLSFRAMDRSRVAMIDFFLPNTAFSKFDCESSNISFNLDEFKKLVKRATKKDTVSVTLENEKLVIRISGNSASKRSFTMPILEINLEAVEPVPAPKITFTQSAHLTISGICSVIEDCALVSDFATFVLGENYLDIKATGDLMSAIINLKTGDDILVDTAVTEQQRASFSLSFLDKISKAIKPYGVVEVYIKTDMPLKIKVCLDVEGTLEYYLAPRIEVE